MTESKAGVCVHVQVQFGGQRGVCVCAGASAGSSQGDTGDAD